MDNVDYLPIWKKNSTAEEWFMECAMMARKFPQRFEQIVLCYREPLKSGQSQYRVAQRNCNLAEEIGLFEIGKLRAHEDSKA